MTLSTDGNGNFNLSNLKLYGICMIKSNGITNIHESLEIKDNNLRIRFPPFKSTKSIFLLTKVLFFIIYYIY